MALNFGDHAATPPSAPGASSAAIAPDKTPASMPLMAAPGVGPLAWLALALALGWLLTRGG